MIKAFIFSCLFVFASFANASDVVRSCLIGPGTQVHLLKESKVYDTYLYSLRINKEEKQPLFGSADKSRGTAVRSQCARQKSLVVSGEFTSNFLQGVALIYASGKFERIDFAERSRPSWLYLGEREALIVFQTHGNGETSKQYLVYRHTIGNQEDAKVDATDTLPDSRSFNVVHLK